MCGCALLVEIAKNTNLTKISTKDMKCGDPWLLMFGRVMMHKRKAMHLHIWISIVVYLGSHPSLIHVKIAHTHVHRTLNMASTLWMFAVDVIMGWVLLMLMVSVVLENICELKICLPYIISGWHWTWFKYTAITVRWINYYNGYCHGKWNHWIVLKFLAILLHSLSHQHSWERHEHIIFIPPQLWHK